MANSHRIHVTCTLGIRLVMHSMNHLFVAAHMCIRSLAHIFATGSFVGGARVRMLTCAANLRSLQGANRQGSGICLSLLSAHHGNTTLTLFALALSLSLCHTAASTTFVIPSEQHSTITARCPLSSRGAAVVALCCALITRLVSPQDVCLGLPLPTTRS